MQYCVIALLAYSTMNSLCATQNMYTLKLSVCVCVCGDASCAASARRCACARTRAVFRELADGAGAVRRVPRPPTRVCARYARAHARRRSLGHVCVCVSYMEFCGCVLCDITCIANTYKKHTKTHRLQKTQLLYTMVCSNVVRTACRVRGRLRAPCRAG